MNLLLLVASLIAPPDEAIAISVESDLGEIDEAVQQTVTEELEKSASERGHASDASAPNALVVSVTWHEGSSTDFAIELKTSGPGQEERHEDFTCVECSPAKLLADISAKAEPLIEELFAEPPAPTEAAPPPSPPPADSPPPAPDRRPLGGLGWGGVGSLALGVAATAAGTAFIVLGERRLPSDPTKFQNFRPAGYGLVAGGSAAIATGAVLLVLDRKRSRRTVALPFGPGVQVIGRF